MPGAAKFAMGTEYDVIEGAACFGFETVGTLTKGMLITKWMSMESFGRDVGAAIEFVGSVAQIKELAVDSWVVLI
jgi:hypothetical protein